MYEYDTWAQWAQAPAGNIAERNEGISNYIKSLTLNAYISEYGTQDERNGGRNQETAALVFIHMESFGELDELRREAMMTTATAFAAVKNPGGRGWERRCWLSNACGEAGEDGSGDADSRVDR